MNVLMVEPGKAPYEMQIGNDLRSMQGAVGGYIQAVYPYEEPVALICKIRYNNLRKLKRA